MIQLGSNIRRYCVMSSVFVAATQTVFIRWWSRQLGSSTPAFSCRTYSNSADPKWCITILQITYTESQTIQCDARKVSKEVAILHANDCQACNLIRHRHASARWPHKKRSLIVTFGVQLRVNHWWSFPRTCKLLLTVANLDRLQVSGL